MAEGLANRLPHNQSQDFSTTSSHNSSERSGSLSGWFHYRGWVRDGGVSVSSSPGRWKTSHVHFFAGKNEGTSPLEHQQAASHWPLLKKKAFCKTYLEIIGESSHPACLLVQLQTLPCHILSLTAQFMEQLYFHINPHFIHLPTRNFMRR